LTLVLQSCKNTAWPYFTFTAWSY